MIDFTPQQSRAYLKTIEASGVTQDQIDYDALQLLRGLTPLDMSEALHDDLPRILSAVIDHRHASEALRTVDDFYIAGVVRSALWDYCQRIAKRELEA